MLRLFSYLPREKSFDKYPAYSLRLLQIVECDCVVLCSAKFFQVAYFISSMWKQPKVPIFSQIIYVKHLRAKFRLLFTGFFSLKSQTQEID